MRNLTRHDRAALALGLTSLLSLISLVLRGDLRFAVVEGAAIGVAVVLGGLAVIAGWFARPKLSVVAGLAFLVAAVLQVVLVTVRETWLGGNISTASLWLGLGIGLLVVGIARPTAVEQES